MLVFFNRFKKKKVNICTLYYDINQIEIKIIYYKRQIKIQEKLE